MNLPKTKYFKPFVWVLFCAILFQCKSPNPEPSSKASETEIADEKIEVSVIPLTKTTFYKEIVSNGKLYATRKSELRFRVSEIIQHINVKNGDLVQTNQLIATLDNFLLKNSLQLARQQVERSRLELEDLLIMQGFSIKDTLKIPGEIWRSLRIKSGYEKALADKDVAAFNLENTQIKTPFAGIIANLKVREQNQASAGEPFCTVIDNSEFDAEFSILETELSQVKVNQRVKIRPFALDSIEVEGYISEINPLINEHGLVTLKARVKNPKKQLFEGMNVKVLVGNSIANQLVVPKEAVLMRQGKQVVFTVEDGRAKWNYVKTGYENSREYTIAEGLDAGVKVIVTNNLNLGHDAVVEVIGGK